jgi:predicted metal-dependent phosphoesterase TrpH
MKKYYYDLHCHTEKSSDCPAKIKDIVRIAKERGLDGLAITDHNQTYKKETCIDGIDIIPANEIDLKNGSHLLAYFVNSDFPEKMSLKQAVSEIKKQKGYAVLAHPFRREHGRFRNRSQEGIEQDLRIVDGIEAGNSSDSDQARESALKLKKDYPEKNFFLTAGSDAHMAGRIGFSVVAVKEKLNSNNFSQALLEAELIVRPESKVFREKDLAWKKLLFGLRITKILFFFRLQRFKKLFYAIFLKNYFRFNNIRAVSIKFNFNEKNE